MLYFVIPTGPFCKDVRRKLKAAGYKLQKPDRKGFCGNDSCVSFFERHPRMIPGIVARCNRAAGMTDSDRLFRSRWKARLLKVANLRISPNADLQIVSSRGIHWFSDDILHTLLNNMQLILKK